MNRILYRIFTLLTLSGLVMAASCSDDEEATPSVSTPGVEFPSLPQSPIEVRQGETAAIEFTAFENWKISADRNWVRFAFTGSDAQPQVSVVGREGAQQVTITVGDEGADFDSDTATVTLYTASKSLTFGICRVASARELTLYKVTEELDDEGFPFDKFTPMGEGDRLEFAYSDYAQDYQVRYAVRSNFKWVASVPEWVKIQPAFQHGESNIGVENPEELTLYYVNVDYNKATLTDMSGKISFSDYYVTSGEAVASFDLQCEGTAHWNRILTVIPQDAPLLFNPNGMYSGGDMGQETEGFEFSALSEPEGYRYYLVAQSSDPMTGGLRYGVWTTKMEWNPDTQQMEEVDVEVFDAQDDLFWFELAESADKEAAVYPNVMVSHRMLTASGNDEGEARHAVMVAIPEGVAKKAGIEKIEDLLQRTPVSCDMKEEFKQYIIANVEQGAAGGGLKFAWAESVDGVTIEPMGEEELSKWSADFGVKQGYVVTYTDFSSMSMAILKLDGTEGTCAIGHTDPAKALYTKQQGWLVFGADMGFAGFRFAFTNTHEDFKKVEGGKREATVILTNTDTGEMVVAIRVVQCANYEDFN